MADVERQVKIAFEGDDRISPVIDSINGKLTSFASSVQGVTGPMADLAAGVLKVEASFAALAAGGLAYAFAKSMDFENATIELKKVIGDQIGSLDDARKYALALSDQYGESASKVLLATANYKQAGFDINESFTLTKAAMDLVIAGSISSGEASEYLISILKGFKAPGEEATRVIDILNEVSNSYATDVRQLAIGMGELSPVAKLMGFSFEETAGILTPVIEVFRDGSESANALKTGLLKLVDDRSSVVDTLKAMGVAQFDLNGNMRSGKDILFDVSKAFVGLSDEQKIYFAQQLAGIEQGARMVEVFNGLAKSQEITAVAMKSAGSAAAEVQARLESAEVSINRFKVGFENLAIIVGDQFRVAAQSAVDGGTAIELALRNAVNSGSFKPIFDVLNQFSADIGVVLQQVARNLPAALAGVDFSGFLQAIKNLGGEFQSLFEAFFGKVDLTSAQGLQLAVQKIVDGLTALTNVTAGILDSWEPFARALGAAATSFSESSEGTAKLTGNILGFGQAIDKVLGFTGTFTGAMTALSGSIGLLALTHVPSAITAFSALGIAGELVASAIGSLGVVAAAAAAGWVLDKVLDATLPGWEKNKTAIAETAYALTGASDATGDWIGATEQAAVAATETAAELEALAKSLFDLPDQKQITFDAIDRASPEFQAILKEVQAIPTERETTVTAKADTASIESTKKIITTILPDGVIVLTQVRPDQDSIDKTQNALNGIPDKKYVEMQLQGQIDQDLLKIKTSAELVQAAMKWKAEIELTSVKETQETLRAFSENTKAMFLDTGDVINTALGQLTKLEGLDKYHLEDLIAAESRRRDELLASQIKMNNFQMDYIKARTDALARGDGMITINAQGLEPELELVLHKIIELTQVKANEEGLAFLLGVTA